MSIDSDAPSLPPPFNPETEPPPEYRQICNERETTISENPQQSESDNSHNNIETNDNSAPIDATSDLEPTSAVVPPLYQEVAPIVTNTTDTQQEAPQLSDRDEHASVSTPDRGSESVARQSPPSSTPLIHYEEVRELRETRVAAAESNNLLSARESPPPLSVSSQDRESPSQWRSYNVAHHLNEYVDSPDARFGTTNATTTDVGQGYRTPPELDLSHFSNHNHQHHHHHHVEYNNSILSPPPLLTPPPLRSAPPPGARHNYSNVFPARGAVVDDLLDEWDDFKIPPGGTLV